MTDQFDLPQSGGKGRRTFLAFAGAAVAVAAFDFNLSRAFAQRGARVAGGAVDLGSGDAGILNFAYALEQLEAAFYTMVVDQPYRMSESEYHTLVDIRDHEISHREFLKGALGGGAIPDLEVTFDKVKFNNRQSVLTTARTFEDLGVSAYNGAGPLLRNPSYLEAAGSIVSVEARHAAIIRDLLNPMSGAFAGNDVVNGAGLDVSRAASQVLPKAAPFILTPVSASQLP